MDRGALESFSQGRFKYRVLAGTEGWTGITYLRDRLLALAATLLFRAILD